MAADQLRDFLEHGAVRHSVNFPDALLARHQGSRIAIANKNVPGVVGRISTALAEAGLNISEMHNGSKGDYAYTLVDVDGPVPPKVFEGIRRLGGVLSARLL
jgi:D-3-phosphoglycerate dehydrogenase